MARGRGDEEDDLWHGIPALQAANGAGEGPQPAARAGTAQTAAPDAAAAPDLAALIGFLRAHLKGGAGGRAIAGALFGGVFAPAQALIRARRDLTIWLAVFLALGIGAWFALPNEPLKPHYLTAAGLGLCAALVAIRSGRGGQLLFTAPAVICAGFLLAGLRAHLVEAPSLGFRFYGPVEGRIVAVDRSGSDKIRLTLDQLRLDRIAPEKTPERIRISLQEPPGEGAQAWLDPAPGQRVMLTAHLMPFNGPALPEGYDFRRHAWFERIGAVGYTRAPVLLAAPPEAGDWAMAAHRLRMRVSQAIQEAEAGQAGAVAAALLVGDRSGITNATNEIMRGSNLFHIIAISGLHMGMLTGFVFAALNAAIALVPRLALRVQGRKIAAIGGLIAGTIYLWISGGSVATERAYVMTSVMLLAIVLDRRALSLRTVAMAACLILIFTPEALVSPGFQMSFGATVALIVMAGPWGRIARRLPRVIRPVALLVATSFIAGMVTAPIAAVHFNRMAEYGVLANLFAVPVMGALVMPAGVIAALLAPFGLAAPALWVMAKGTAWILFVAQTVSGFDGAVIAVPTPPAWVLPALALGAIVIVLSRGFARTLGALALIGGFTAWEHVTPPEVLIASEGELVGVMTPQGRALSKAGSGFVATSWLDADGDAASPETAAARPLFKGEKGARLAQWHGYEIAHLTGKSAAERLPEVCESGRIVVIAARLAPQEPRGDCLLIDQRLLRETGALSLRLATVEEAARAEPNSPALMRILAAQNPDARVRVARDLWIETAQDHAGQRLWTR